MGHAAILRAISSALSAIKIFGIYSLEQERLRKLERDLPRLKAQLGQIGLDEEIAALNEQGKKARSRLAETNQKFNEFETAGLILGQLIPTSELAVKLARPAFAGVEDLKSAEVEYLEYLSWFNQVAEKMAEHAEREFKNGKIGAEELQAIYQTLIDAEGNDLKQTQLRDRLSSLVGKYSEKKIKADTDGAKQQKAKLSPIDVWSTMPTPAPTGATTPQSLFGGVNLGAPKISRVPTEEPKKQFQELSTESQAFISAFDSGMQAVGQGIHQWVGGAFRRTFGEANSLLEQFLQAFIDALAQLAIQQGFKAIFTAAGFPIPFAKGGIITEPIFGIGKSGQSYLFGESGREAVIPLAAQAASRSLTSGGFSQPYVTVVPLISSKGLAVQVEVGNRQNARVRT